MLGYLKYRVIPHPILIREYYTLTYVKHLSNLLHVLCRLLISKLTMYQLYRIINHRFQLFHVRLLHDLKSILLLYLRSKRQLEDLFYHGKVDRILHLLVLHKYLLFVVIAKQSRYRLVHLCDGPKQQLFHVGL